MPNIITVDINDKTFKTVKSLDVDTDLDTFGFEFNLDINIPIEESDFKTLGEAIKIKVDGEELMTGFIEKTSTSYSADSANLRISGRDKLCDFSDSRVSNKIFKTPIGFIQILEKLLKETGYKIVSNNIIGLQRRLAQNEISIINEYGNVDNFETNESIGFGKDESAYQLIQRLADKRQLVIGTNGVGNIVIRKIGDSRAATILLNDNRFGEPNLQNNIKDGSVNRDESKLFYEYRIFSKSSGIEPTTTTTEGNISRDILKGNSTQYSGVFYDESVRKTRKFIDHVTGLTNAQCYERAKWEANIRRARSFDYSCAVSGFRQNLKEVTNFSVNPLWRINQLVYVYDKQADIDEELLVKSVKYSKSLNGTICQLKLVDPLSYSNSVFKVGIKRLKKQLGIDWSKLANAT